jgi:hypothetical protein
MVHLQGGYACAIGANGNAVFDLPAGYRPADGKILLIPAVCRSCGPTQLGQIGIRGSDGAVLLETTQSAPTGEVRLEGISFRANG